MQIDCKNHLAIELAYRSREEFRDPGSSNIMIYVRLRCIDILIYSVVDASLGCEQLPV